MKRKSPILRAFSLLVFTCFFFPYFWVSVGADYGQNFNGVVFVVNIEMGHEWGFFNNHTANFLVTDGVNLRVFISRS